MAKLRPLDTFRRQRRYAEIMIQPEGGCGKNWISNRYASLRSTAQRNSFLSSGRALDISQPTGSLLLKNHEIILLLTRCLSGSGSG